MIDVSNIDNIRYKFTELGKTISDLVSKHDGFANNVLKSLRDDSLKAAEVASSGTFNNLKSITNMMDNQMRVMSSTFNSMIQNADKSFNMISITMENSSTKFSELTDKVSKMISDMEKEQIKNKQASQGGSKKKKPNIVERFTMKEWRSIKGSIGGLARKVMIPAPGNIFGGLFLIMGWGYKERDRIRKEAGEATNIMVAAYDSGVRGMVAKGTNFLSGLQEHMQKFMGIARSEVQGVAGAFVSGGVGINEMLQSVDVNMRGVKDNFITLTLAVDKMFELSGGETANRTVKMMADYGKSIEDASKSVLKLMMTGKDSGIGTMQFVKNIESAADELKKFGYDIDDVVDLAVKMQEGFEEIGVPRQFAGRQTAIGLKQIASGINQMSDDWKVLIGEKMGYGQGLEARQRMMESFTRVSKGSRPEELMGMIGKLVDTVMTATGGDEASARLILEKDVRLGFEGAKIMMMIKDSLDKGDFNEAKEITKENMAQLQKAFQVESTKQSVFEREMNKIMKGMEKVGNALTGLAINTLAWLITYFKALPDLLNVMIKKALPFVEPSQDEMKSYMYAMGRLKAHSFMMSQNSDQLIGALSDVGEGIKGLGADFLGSSLKGLKNAWNWNPDTTDTSGGGVPIAGAGGGAQVQTIIIPIPVGSKGDEYKATIDPSKSSFIGGVTADVKQWVGGGLSIVSKGTDQQGNVRVSLIGNCPRCGLTFGEQKYQAQSWSMQNQFGEFSAQDEEALARMIESEVSGKGIKGREVESLGIAWTALNRLADAKKRYGKTLYDVITGGKGFGKQGERPYSTAKKASAEAREFAHKVLSGESGYASPVGGATYFYHSKPGVGMKRGGKSLALPPFTRNLANTVNIPYSKKEGHYARFYSEDETEHEAPRSKELDEFLIEKHAAKIDKEQKQETASALEALGMPIS